MKLLIHSHPAPWLRLAGVCIAALVLGVTTRAQDGSARQKMRAALEMRANLAIAVARNALSPAEAIQQLQTGGASGLQLEKDTDFAYAAIDVGRRLMGAEQPEAADVFFRAAEPLLAQAANRATATREKAGLLKNLAVIRADYLGKVDQARADMAEAIRLQPGDVRLQQAKARMEGGRIGGRATTRP